MAAGLLEPRTKRRAIFLTGFTIYFVALWLLWSSPVIYPLKIFVVLLHEISHGAAAVLTGGSIQGIAVSADQGGVCQCSGGNAFLTLSAGYLGSLGWGALILVAARASRPAPRTVTAIIGFGLLVITALYVRNPFGIVFGALFGAALVAVRGMPTRGHVFLLTALGLTSCLYALLDIKSDVLDRPYLRSDAAVLAELTGIPTLLWGLLWIAAGGAVSWVLFKRALDRA